MGCHEPASRTTTTRGAAAWTRSRMATPASGYIALHASICTLPDSTSATSTCAQGHQRFGVPARSAKDATTMVSESKAYPFTMSVVWYATTVAPSATPMPAMAEVSRRPGHLEPWTVSAITAAGRSTSARSTVAPIHGAEYHAVHPDAQLKPHCVAIGCGWCEPIANPYVT